MQRTRSSASPPHSPLTRYPLGSQGRRAVSIALGLAALIGIGGIAYSADAMSAADARRELLETNFTMVTKTQEVPEPVRVLLAALTKTKGQVLAEPGAKYQETDVVTEPGLPRRRLVLAGNGKGVYFVAYELGGRGHSHHIAVFEWVPGQISLVWRAVLDRRVSGLNDLRELVRQGKYKDDPAYAF